MKKELLNSKFIIIESWAYRARHQVESGNVDRIFETIERIKLAVGEIEKELSRISRK